MKKSLIFVLVTMMFIPSIVKAESLSLNLDQVEYDPNVLLQDVPKSDLSPEWFDENGNLLPLVGFKTIYTENIIQYDENGVPSVLEENIITQEEYENSDNADVAPYSDFTYCDDFGTKLCIETSYKKMMIGVVQDGTFPNVKIGFVNIWKQIPKVKSFDSIGMIYRDFKFKSVYGYQYYNTNSNHNTQSQYYANDGTNTKKQTGGISSATGGASLSQNLVDDVYDLLRNEIWVYSEMQDAPAVATSYQHATTNITLSTSLNFDFSLNGMGHVYDWKTSYNKWDNTPGLCSSFSNHLWISCP